MKYNRYWELKKSDNVNYGNKDPFKILLFAILFIVILSAVMIIVV